MTPADRKLDVNDPGVVADAAELNMTPRQLVKERRFVLRQAKKFALATGPGTSKRARASARALLRKIGVEVENVDAR